MRDIPAPITAGRKSLFSKLKENENTGFGRLKKAFALVGHKREESDNSGSLYCQSQSPLVLGAGSGHAPWEDLSPLSDKPAQSIRVLVIDL